MSKIKCTSVRKSDKQGIATQQNSHSYIFFLNGIEVWIAQKWFKLLSLVRRKVKNQFA